MKTVPYEYKNMPIPGGGYVTGFLYHPNFRDIMYIRTDIGGTYRFNFSEDRFETLIASVGMDDLSETFPAAIAVDPSRPERLYIASGVYGIDGWDRHGPMKETGVLSISDDFGQHFIRRHIPAMVHGNLNGRGTGTRLVADPGAPDTLYFASQCSGLLRTRDLGLTWEKLTTGGESYMTLVWVSPDSRTVVAGTAGVLTSHGLDPDKTGVSAFHDSAETASGASWLDTANQASEACSSGVTGGSALPLRRGHSLYISRDGGESFAPLSEPEDLVPADSRFPGHVAQRCCFDGRYLYITMCNTGADAYALLNGYSCDAGAPLGGRVIRYAYRDGCLADTFEEITPGSEAFLADPAEPELNTAPKDKPYRFGFGGIACCPAVPGLLICATIGRRAGDFIFLSRDCGTSWKCILFNLDIGKITFKTSYMKPEYNGGVSLIHWMSDLAINPFNPDEAWFNCGCGTFSTRNLLAEKPVFGDRCEGLEETVHIKVYAPVKGPAVLIDAIGDYGGFVFFDTDRQCENSFADASGNRYLTCMNADSPDGHPELIAATARGNWTDRTKGGIILSRDNGRSWDRLPMPEGLTSHIDALCEKIEHPNTNSGWIAMSADGCDLVWCIADGSLLPADAVVRSSDFGQTWHRVMFEGIERIKIFADRTDPELMLAFGNRGEILVSRDRGRTFVRAEINSNDLSSTDLQSIDFTGIDVFDRTEIRGAYGERGVFYLPLWDKGLWKLEVISRSMSGSDTSASPDKIKITLRRLSAEGDRIFHMGLGIAAPGRDYSLPGKALYVSGFIGGVYGFWRSLDEARTWERINTDDTQFGDINSIDGDKREFGRFFLGTASLGLITGSPASKD